MNCIDQTTGEGFVLYHGDCVDVLRGLPDQSIHYSIFRRHLRVSTRTATARETWETAARMKSFFLSTAFPR